MTFPSRNFFQGHTAQMNEPIHTYLVNQAYESANFFPALQRGNFWIRYESGMEWTLNPDIFLSGDVTRSSPVLYRGNCVQDCNIDPCSVANIPIVVLEWIRIRVGSNSIWIRIRVGVEFVTPERKIGELKQFPDTCGRGLNQKLRVKLVKAWKSCWLWFKHQKHKRYLFFFFTYFILILTYLLLLLLLLTK